MAGLPNNMYLKLNSYSQTKDIFFSYRFAKNKNAFTVLKIYYVYILLEVLVSTCHVITADYDYTHIQGHDSSERVEETSAQPLSSPDQRNKHSSPFYCQSMAFLSTVIHVLLSVFHRMTSSQVDQGKNNNWKMPIITSPEPFSVINAFLLS